MSIEEAACIAAARAHPGDAGPALVYADWLEGWGPAEAGIGAVTASGA